MYQRCELVIDVNDIDIFHDQIVPFQPLFLKLILITSFEYFRSPCILFKNRILSAPGLDSEPETQCGMVVEVFETLQGALSKV